MEIELHFHPIERKNRIWMTTLDGTIKFNSHEDVVVIQILHGLLLIGKTNSLSLVLYYVSTHFSIEISLYITLDK